MAGSVVRTATMVGLTVALIGGCGTVEQGPTKLFPSGLSTEVLAVSRQLNGNFTNLAQAQRDSEYAPLALHLRRIWPERTDACWIYMELTPARAALEPVCQRVLRVFNSAGQVRCEPNSLPGDGHAYIGAWGDPALFAQTTPEMLAPLEACAFVLISSGADQYSGSVPQFPCGAAGSGATISCELRVVPGRIEAQGRFMNAAGAPTGTQLGGPFEFIAN